MVINKNSIGRELNKKERKKLIYLYEEYIKDPKDEFIKQGAWDFVIPDTFFYTKTVEIAGNAALKIFEGELSIEEAKKLFKRQ